MKKYLSILLLFFISCNRNKPETTWIISGADTVEIIGHYSWRHLGSPCGGEGSNDTLTGRFTYRFFRCPDTTRLDTILVDSIHNSILKDSVLTIDVSNAIYF